MTVLSSHKCREETTCFVSGMNEISASASRPKEALSRDCYCAFNCARLTTDKDIIVCFLSTLRYIQARTMPTEILSDRAEIALAFCKECLGWPDASGGGSRYIIENRRRPELSHAYGKMHGFQLDPTDAGNVMNAVKEWCDINAIGFSLKYSPGAKYPWCARMGAHAAAQGDDLCDLLIRVCLLANHNLAERNEGTAVIDSRPQRRNPAILDNPWGNIRKNAETALAFCRECLGWKDAHICNDFGYVFVKESVPKHLAATPIPPWERSFSFNENHIDRVMGAVRIWCDGHAAGFVLEYFPSGSAVDSWHASLGAHAEAHSDLASTALMSACISAHRKETLPGNSSRLRVELRK
jgi:hypothetical protein